MNKKTRLFLLGLCSICFLIGAPLLIFYSMGFRIDFEKKKIVATGGIYIRTYPLADEIVLDSQILGKPSVFSNAFFIQGLLPRQYEILIKKRGYFDYKKTVLVKEKEVTKLENIILFKKLLALRKIFENIDYLSVSPDKQHVLAFTYQDKKVKVTYFPITDPSSSHLFSLSPNLKINNVIWNHNNKASLVEAQTENKVLLYYLFKNVNGSFMLNPLSQFPKNCQKILFSPENDEILYQKKDALYSYSLVSNREEKILEEKILDYQIYKNKILILSTEGEVSLFDPFLKSKENISNQKLIIKPNKKYQIFVASSYIFFKEDDSLFLFNPSQKIFEILKSPSSLLLVLSSPDEKKIIYCTNERIDIYFSSDFQGPKRYYTLFQGKDIKNCQWLNNNYLLFTSENNVIILETELPNGKINPINLSEAFFIPNSQEEIPIKSPLLFFHPSSAKIYLLTEKILLESEKILP